MVRDFRPDAIVGDIYDAALDPDGLQRLAASMMKVGAGVSANVIIHHENGASDAATHGLPDEALRRYAEYYGRINPAISAAAAWDRTRIGRYSDALAARRFRQTEFYADFARVFDTVHVMGMHQLAIGRGSRAEIGVHRGDRCRDFTDGDVRRFQSIVPHLQRALHLRRRLAPRLQPHIGLAVLETLAFGCVICDAAGRVLLANQAAHALERAGAITLAASRQGLGARSPTERAEFAALIRAAATGGGGGMLINAVHGARLFVLATPLPGRLNGRPGQALVTFRSEAANPTVDAALLSRLFQLTPAEARLAVALAAGRSLAEIGAESRVTENTLRTQVASALRKTGAANQRELVRMLNLMPPVNQPAAREQTYRRRASDSAGREG
ncbi:MAG: hypothetical protein J0H41_10120 [Rhizobiales bacterium]|nr:hypothetical protein [Hyphomicrobiales bacterium]